MPTGRLGRTLLLSLRRSCGRLRGLTSGGVWIPEDLAQGLAIASARRDFHNTFMPLGDLHMGGYGNVPVAGHELRGQDREHAPRIPASRRESALLAGQNEAQRPRVSIWFYRQMPPRSRRTPLARATGSRTTTNTTETYRSLPLRPRGRRAGSFPHSLDAAGRRCEAA